MARCRRGARLLWAPRGSLKAGIKARFRACVREKGYRRGYLNGTNGFADPSTETA